MRTPGRSPGADTGRHVAARPPAPWERGWVRASRGGLPAGRPGSGCRRRGGRGARGPGAARCAGGCPGGGCLPGGGCVLDSGTAGCACIACAARGHLEVPARRWAVVAIAHVDVRRRGDDGAGPVAPLPVGYLALVRDESDLDGVSGQGPPAFREFRLGTAGVASTGRGDLERQPEPLLLRTRDDEIYGHR